jgi:hypothetical protein
MTTAPGTTGRADEAKGPFEMIMMLNFCPGAPRCH